MEIIGAVDRRCCYDCCCCDGASCYCCSTAFALRLHLLLLLLVCRVHSQAAERTAAQLLLARSSVAPGARAARTRARAQSATCASPTRAVTPLETSIHEERERQRTARRVSANAHRSKRQSSHCGRERRTELLDTHLLLPRSRWWMQCLLFAYSTTRACSSCSSMCVTMRLTPQTRSIATERNTEV